MLVLCKGNLRVLTLPPMKKKVRKPVTLRLMFDHNVSIKGLVEVDKHLLYTYAGAKGNGRDVWWSIPAGFEFDGASIPRGLDWFAHRYGLALPAALVHDYLCVRARVHHSYALRKLADKTFHAQLLHLGVKPWRAKAMYLAVRAAGMVSL